MLAELAVFESLNGGFFEDGKGPFWEKGRQMCASGGDMG